MNALSLSVPFAGIVMFMVYQTSCKNENENTQWSGSAVQKELLWL